VFPLYTAGQWPSRGQTVCIDVDRTKIAEQKCINKLENENLFKKDFHLTFIDLNLRYFEFMY
jgi:hypothetical protein